jgi:hypothetical protein
MLTLLVLLPSSASIVARGRPWQEAHPVRALEFMEMDRGLDAIFRENLAPSSMIIPRI